MITQPNLHIIIGLGATGLSCVHFLNARQVPIVVMDTRTHITNLDLFRQTYPDIAVYAGEPWPQAILNQATALVVSPGVSIHHPAIVAASKAGVEIMGDIELFVRYNQTPIIAITGANGKSTVTTLVGEMAKRDGKRVAVVGNIGIPALTVLSHDAQYDLIVMELSSFQLETTHQLKPLAATVLNITPDHLDRYASFADYVAAKHRIYQQAENVVINQQDPLSDSTQIAPTAKRWGFTLAEPTHHQEFGLRKIADETWLAVGNKNLLPTRAMKLMGQHNIANALSALALGTCAELSLPAMLTALETFPGLDHRCQWVCQENDVVWINDSKGTNIGACQAALQGLGSELTGKIVLLLGGDGKGADFTELKNVISQYCRAAIVMGKDALNIAQVLENTLPIYQATDMNEAVQLAKQTAQKGDVVLLSPACASLDQYRDFEHRGDTFMALLKGF